MPMFSIRSTTPLTRILTHPTSSGPMRGRKKPSQNFTLAQRLFWSPSVLTNFILSDMDEWTKPSKLGKHFWRVCQFSSFCLPSIFSCTYDITGLAESKEQWLCTSLSPFSKVVLHYVINPYKWGGSRALRPNLFHHPCITFTLDITQTLELITFQSFWHLCAFTLSWLPKRVPYPSFQTNLGIT